MDWLQQHLPLLGSLYYASEWAIRIAMLLYVPQRRPPAAARTWLLLILLLPWPGLIVYAIFGSTGMTPNVLGGIAMGMFAGFVAGRVKMR